MRDWVSRIPDDLVPQIGEHDLHLAGEVVVRAAEASEAIARFDAEMGGVVAPFTALLLRSESTSSSRIENLTSGAKAIAVAELGGGGTRNALEILGNVAAMNAALALAHRLDGDALLDMHRALMARRHSDIAGRWRTEQVWIGGDGYGPHGAAFVPPHHDHVPDLIDDLIAYIRRADVPVLTQAAIAHAQFETIHPFVDGNGRTGRALVHAMLRGRGLTRQVTVPVSAGLLTDTDAYFGALTAYRRGDPSPVVAMMADASLRAIANARQLVSDLRRTRLGWDERITSRRGSAAWRLADLLLRQPVVDARVVAAELGISTANALRPVAALVEAGVLDEFTGKARRRMWQSREILSILDEFASRAGRR